MLIVASLLVALVKSDLAKIMAKEKHEVLNEDETSDINLLEKAPRVTMHIASYL